VTPFEEELFRLLQNARSSVNPFSSQEEDAAKDIQLITAFAKKWDVKKPYEDALVKIEELSKRLERDAQQLTKSLSVSLLKEIIPIIDSAEQLTRYLDPSSTLSIAVEFIVEQLGKILSKRDGQVIIPQVGEPFNPTMHSAISAERSNDPYKNVNTVAEVMRNGYSALGQVIRPAEVKVWI